MDNDVRDSSAESIRTVLIVDDEPLARMRLARLLEDCTGYRLVGSCADGLSALEQARRHTPDVVLLDIRMPGLNGLQVASELQRLGQPPAVVFCTAYDDHALDALQVQAAGYLLKPIRGTDLLASLERAARPNRLQQSALGNPSEASGEPGAAVLVQNRQGVERIPLDAVFAFVADQKYVSVFHEGGEALIDTPLKLLEQTHGERFLRIHRNALVALDRVERLLRVDGQHQIRLRGLDRDFVVSRRHAAAVRSRLAERP
ncbi:MAG: response regulator transcription factor [Pseudomonadota bacterium]|nr:response regulator transcription factor [Pseudomonadota bacterium]